MAHFPRCSFSSGISLSLFTIRFLFLFGGSILRYVFSSWWQYGSQQLLAYLLLISSCFLAQFFLKKIPSPILMLFPEPIAVTSKRGCWLASPESHVLTRGLTGFSPFEMTSTEREAVSPKKMEGLLLKEGGTGAERVKAPECPAAWTSCSQTLLQVSWLEQLGLVKPVKMKAHWVMSCDGEEQ